MHGIDESTVDEVLASTFKQLTSSLMLHNNKAIEANSRALEALLSLRQQLILNTAQGDQASS